MKKKTRKKKSIDTRNFKMRNEFVGFLFRSSLDLEKVTDEQDEREGKTRVTDVHSCMIQYEN